MPFFSNIPFGWIIAGCIGIMIVGIILLSVANEWGWGLGLLFGGLIVAAATGSIWRWVLNAEAVFDISRAAFDKPS